ncbi:MAG: tyrosine--tRNA ligase [Sphaerochaetaceae bacterium]|jgi:tyrosyl-tRNA synthetase|nr:tyrosine--tRNA ligase [Sphaerochaetaceae bacterium]
MNKALQVLMDRGFTKACTDTDALSDLMDREPVTFYIGTDPTGRSLHIGHMVPFFAAHHLQEFGHNPIALVGNGTAMIGDPSGKTELRKMLTQEQVMDNSRHIKEQLSHVMDFSENPKPGMGKAIMRFNGDWLLDLNYISFLREIGSQFSVNKMLTFESYKQRLERGLSFIEFNYQLLQSYDFLILHRENGARLQIGGDDQWGNIVAGTDLIRRMDGDECYGLTFHLITRADGKKMGKSEQGAIFIDPELLSPYNFYQYWRNVPDEDVIKFMKLFTFMSMDEIADWAKVKNINEAKQKLAFEQTKITHGEEEAEKARDAAKAVFSTGGDVSGMPSIELAASDLEKGIGVIDLFSSTDLCKTKSDARRLIQDGGASINGEKVPGIDLVVDSSFVKDGDMILKAGKKRFFRIIVK